MVMAQIGYYLPCEFASIRPCDHILSRLGTDDELESNCSTFMRELRDIGHCLSCVTDESLVIIDELGRGTCTTDGLAIAAAISEALCRSKVRQDLGPCLAFIRLGLCFLCNAL